MSEPTSSAQFTAETVLALLRRCEAAVRAGSPQEELQFADTFALHWERSAFSSAGEALKYHFRLVARRIGADWAPLVSPQEAGGFPSVMREDPSAPQVELAYFRKARLLGYMRLEQDAFARATAWVGVVAAYDDDAGASGEGDETHVGLPVRRWVM
jgi:hypothetical protein